MEYITKISKLYSKLLKYISVLKYYQWNGKKCEEQEESGGFWGDVHAILNE